MGSTALADVFSKIFNREVPNENDVILCFAKTDKQKANKTDTNDDEHDTRMSAKQRNLKREWARQSYVKPLAAAGIRLSAVRHLSTSAPTDRMEAEKSREKRLCSEACRGVVQLFNAVQQQQISLDKQLRETGTTEAKREKVMASLSTADFLDRLSAGGTKKKKTTVP